VATSNREPAQGTLQEMLLEW